MMSINDSTVPMCINVVYNKNIIKKNKKDCDVFSNDVVNDSDRVTCVYGESTNLFDNKFDRRAQYIRNKKQKKINKNKNNGKYIKCVKPKNKNKNKNKNIYVCMSKALVDLPNSGSIKIAAENYDCQMKCLNFSTLNWAQVLRPDMFTNGTNVFWFHLEKLFSVIQLLRGCDSVIEMGHILNLYLGIYFDCSVVTSLLELFDKCMGSIMTCQASGLETFKELLQNWQAIKESEAAAKIYFFISTVLATGLCKINNINVQYKGLDIFRIAATKRVANLIDLTQVIIETTIFFYERGCVYLSTNNYWDLLYSDKYLMEYEKKYSFVISNEPHALAGEWSDIGMSNLEYFSIIEDLVNETLSMLKVSTGPEKANLTAKLVLLEKTKVRIKRANITPSMRMKPFGILLFGGTGVGKSSILPYIIHYLNLINGFESNRDRVVTLNPADKYQSEYKSNTNVVIIDDIMNQKLDVSEGNPGDLIIRLLNNIPTAALKADVDSKGNVMMSPNFVYGTTNVKTLCASQLSNEPVSILRRFEFFITMRVKPEYKRNDSDMLDSSKLSLDLIPDAWLYTIEYVIPIPVHEGHPAKPSFIVAELNGVKMEDINFKRLLHFLGVRSKEHFTLQKEFVGKSADIFKLDICKHCDQLEGLCSCNDINQNTSFLWKDTDDMISDNISVADHEETYYTKRELRSMRYRDSEYDMDRALLLDTEEMEILMEHQAKTSNCNNFFGIFDDLFDKDRIRSAKIRKNRNIINVKEESSIDDDITLDDLDDDTPVSSSPSRLNSIFNQRNINQVIFGTDLPSKTRFEYIRDSTISKITQSNFLRSFISGENNSFFGWSIICWNFLRSKWESDKWDCLFFMILVIVNTLLISIITVPLSIVTKLGLISVNYIDDFYKFVSDRSINFIIKHAKLSAIRSSRVRKIKKVMKYSLYGVTLLSAVYIIKKAFRFYKGYKSHNSVPEGFLPVDDHQKVDHWLKPVINKLPPSLKSSTTTPEQLRCLIEKKVANVLLICSQTGKKSQMMMFPLCNNIWVINSHALTGFAQTVHVTIVSPNTIGPNFTDIIGLNNTYNIPDNDLSLVVLTRGGSQYDFTEYFPLEKEMVRYMCSIIYKNESAIVSEQRVLANAKIINYTCPKKDVKIKGFHYSTQSPTFEGMCMSPLMTYEAKPQIVGFHCCGISGTTNGGGAMLSRNEIKLGVETLLSRKGLLVAHSACNQGLNLEPIGPFKTVKMLDNIHPKSPFNFLEKGTFNLYGQHDGPKQTPSTSVIKTLLSDAVESEFGIPCIWGPPEGIKTYLPRHKEVSKMCDIHPMDPDRVALAAHDYCGSIIDKLDHSKLIGIRPLNKEVTLSGQKGVSQLRSVVMSTSCGFPINKPKNNVLFRTGLSNDYVEDIIEAPDYVWNRVEKCENLLLNGQRCHFVFKASLKDEPKKIGSGKVRVFAGVSLEGLLIVRKYFLPLGVIMMRNPFEFESAVGINAHGREWDNLVRHVSKQGSSRMIAGDYASFDSSMSPSMSMAAFSCLMHLAKKCGYSERDLTIMRGIATEICYPTYDFFGEIVVVAGSEPSGHPMTVFINNIVNSLYIRYAYYSIYDFDKNNFFNKYITQMNYGDDNVMSVSEDKTDFNHTAIQEILGKSGVVYTMADKEGKSIPFIRMEDCSFLKRSFRYDSNRDLYLGPLEPMSLFKTLHTCVKSDTVSLEMQNRDMVSSVLFEAFLQGEQFYTDFQIKMTNVLNKCSVGYWFPEGLPSFASQQEVWDERYFCENNILHENPHGSGVVGDSYIFE